MVTQPHVGVRLFRKVSLRARGAGESGGGKAAGGGFAEETMGQNRECALFSRHIHVRKGRWGGNPMEFSEAYFRACIPSGMLMRARGKKKKENMIKAAEKE